MERTIYRQLLSWKNKQDRKPLILLGARQVGKTYILKKFGQNEFRNLVYVNCHRDAFATNLFRDFNIRRIIVEIERYCDVSITIGETLLFFDEIQEVANGISSLKYFCEDCRSLHVVVAGSLLGIQLKENESFPVGKVNMLKMYPMTFNEYLLACGKHRWVEVLNALDWEAVKPLHEPLVEYLRQYYFVGGMPEAIAKYVNTCDVKAVRSIQHEILETYYLDMSKHTKTQIQRIHQVWESIPTQLSLENKKFFYGSIKKGARAKDFETAMQWLVDAGLVVRVERCKIPTPPLKFYADNASFKLYLLDCGLLACLTEANPNMLLLADYAFVEFKGAFAENFVLQHICSALDTKSFYFSKDNSTMEIDFLIQTEERIVPVEVKAAENVKSKSLSLFVNHDFQAQQLKAVRFSLKPYEDQQWMENVPLYATESFLESLQK